MPKLEYEPTHARKTRQNRALVFYLICGSGVLILDISGEWLEHMIRTSITKFPSPNQFANVVEGAFWTALGIGSAIASRTNPSAKNSFRVAALVLTVFGGFDLVDAYNGGYLQPWWLLVWKGSWLLVLSLLVITRLAR